MVGILDFYGNDKTKVGEVAGPGNFNDPDMVGAIVRRLFHLCVLYDA